MSTTVLQTVKEDSTAYVTVAFFDKDGNAATPSSATWQLHNPETGTEIKAATSLTPASSITITIGASNHLLNSGQAKEKRRLTVKATFGADDKSNDVYEYNVIQLANVS